MASYSQTIKGKYGVKTYQETKATYDWILKSIRQMDATISKIDAAFLFEIGKILCSCKTIEEYVENAYGVSEYSLNNMVIVAYSSEKQIAYFSVSFQNEIWIKAASKSELEEIVQLLNNTELGESEMNASFSASSDTKKSSTIIINGNSNTIANDCSAINSKNVSESKLKQALTAIGQNLLSNWIWYLLCLGVGAFVSRVI